MMFDTYVTVVGTVLTVPEWRRTNATGALMANFRVASHSRRFDKDSGRWVDGDSLRVRVTCWRRLAEGVASSLMVGDPVLVTGRLFTRDWMTEDGQRRVSYEMEASAVGHDLARGRGTFTRNRPTTTTSAVEDAEADARFGGQPTEPVDAGARDAGFGDTAGSGDTAGFGDAAGSEAADGPDGDPAIDDGEPVEFDPASDGAAVLRAAGLGSPGDGDGTDDATDDGEPSATAGARRRRVRVPQPV
jgi:single-strand DNA-binding protein